MDRWRFLKGALIVAIVLLLHGSSSAAQPWVAPARADLKKSPIPADAQALILGKEVFLQNCVPCHGVLGKGDGPAAKSLDRSPANFADAQRMDSQTDGALFWKIGEGRGPMPQWKDALTEEQRWQVIQYIRTLESKKK